MHEITQVSKSHPLSALQPLLTVLGWKDLNPTIRIAEQADQVLTQELRQAYENYQTYPNKTTKETLQSVINTVIEKLKKDQAKAEQLRQEASVQLAAQPQADSSGYLMRLGGWMKQNLQWAFESEDARAERYAAMSQKYAQAIKDLTRFKQDFLTNAEPVDTKEDIVVNDFSTFQSIPSQPILLPINETDKARDDEDRITKYLEDASIVVSNPIPNQLIQIRKFYQYDISQVFSGDYTAISAVETGKSTLPTWLNVQYNVVGSCLGLQSLLLPRDIVISNGTAYVAATAGNLQLIDVNTITEPKLLWVYPICDTSEGNFGIALSTLFNNIIFLANKQAGLCIVNASTFPPKRTGPYYPMSNASDVAVSGNIVFLVNASSLYIIDVSNLGRPKLLSIYTYLVGESKYAYVAAWNNLVAVGSHGIGGIRILDVSNPANPIELSRHISSGAVHDFTIMANTAFIAGGSFLDIVNITDPHHPRRVSTYTASNKMSIDGLVKVSGTTVFVQTGFSFHIVDVSDLTKPQLLSIHVTNTSQSVVVGLGNSSFIGVSQGRKTQVIDMRQGILTTLSLGGQPPISGKYSITVIAQNRTNWPASTTFTLTLDEFPQVKGGLPVLSVFPSQQFSLLLTREQLFTSISPSFLQLSLQIKGEPVPRSRWLAVTPTWLSTYKPITQIDVSSAAKTTEAPIENVLISDSRAFLSSRARGLEIVDLQDPKNPIRLSLYNNDGQCDVKDAAISGNILFLASSGYGVYILNVSDPKNPQRLSTYFEGGSTENIVLSDNILFVANSEAGLHIVSMSDPKNPRRLGNYSTAIGPEGIPCVALSGSTVFIANNYKTYTNLEILDVSSFTHPKWIGRCKEINDRIFEMVVSDNTLFVANNYAGVKIVDITNRTDLKVVSTYPKVPGTYLPYYVRGVAVTGSTLFVSFDEAGLHMVDIRNLKNPSLLSIYPVGVAGRTSKSTVLGSILFVANGLAGLEVINLNNYDMEIKPSANHTGNYHLNLTATDVLGGSAFTTFTIRVEGPPGVNNPVLSQNVLVSQPLFYDVPFDTFTHPNSDLLLLKLTRANQTDAPSWLKFNAISWTIWGTPPSSQDKEIISLRLTAQDPLGQTASSDFNFTVVYAPDVSHTIPNQPLFLIQNRPFHYPIALETVFNGHGYPLTYSLQDMHDGFLPAGLNFMTVNTTLVLFGVPQTIGTVVLSVIAQNNLNYSTSTPFIISVNPDSPPRLKRAIPMQIAKVGEPFYFLLAPDIFEDINSSEKLNYTISGLPDCFTVKQRQDGSLEIEGTPSHSDIGSFSLESSRNILIHIIAQNLYNGSTTTSFDLTLNGSSILIYFFFGGIATSIFTVAKFIGSKVYDKFACSQCCCCRCCSSEELRCTLNGNGVSNTIPLNHSDCILPLNDVLSSQCCFLPVVKVEVETVFPRKSCCQGFKSPSTYYIEFSSDFSKKSGELPTGIRYVKDLSAFICQLPNDTNYSKLAIKAKDRFGFLKKRFTVEVGPPPNQHRSQPAQTHDEESPQSLKSPLLREESKSTSSRSTSSKSTSCCYRFFRKCGSKKQPTTSSVHSIQNENPPKSRRLLS